MAHLNLILAVFWLVLGIGLLVWDDPTGNTNLRVPIGERGVSLGWFALALAAYNVVRWRSIRSRVLQRQTQREAQRRRAEARRASETPPDPTFDFSDPPKREEGPGGRTV